MYNVLLSVFALFVSDLPETDSVRLDRRIDVATVFREAEDALVSPILPRPQWLTGEKKEKQVFRGQAPMGTYDSPPMTVPSGPPLQPMNPYQPANPFQPGADPVLPFLNDAGPTIISGINGPQPQRMGFTPLFDAAYITPSTAKSPGAGHLAVQEYDAALRHVSLLGPDWTFANTLQGGTRIWDGPAKPDFPGSVFRIGWDFLLQSPQYGAWSGQLDFNPSVNTDFHASLAREGVNLDGSATLFYRSNPQLMWVLGVQYWDRVDKIILPNAGVVWNPTDQLELRLLFPKSRISYFLGNHGTGSHWLYASGEYHVESYQIEMSGSGRNQIQLSDYRVAIGVRSDHSWYDKYVEVGYVFGRQVEYLRTTPDFNIGDGIMARFGVRF